MKVLLHESHMFEVKRDHHSLQALMCSALMQWSHKSVVDELFRNRAKIDDHLTGLNLMNSATFKRLN